MNENEMVLKLREMLLQVFCLNSIDEIQEHHALVKDLGAESIDFVEILYLIEKNFSVVLKANEIILGGEKIMDTDIFVNDRLTDAGVKILKNKFDVRSAECLESGMTKIEILSMITVRDLAKIIRIKKENEVNDVSK